MYFKQTLYQPQENQDKDNANWAALQFAIAIASGQRAVIITIPDGPTLATGSQTITIDKPQFCKYCEDAVTMQALSGAVTYTASVRVGGKSFASTKIDSTDNTLTITFNLATAGTLTGVVVTVGGITIPTQILEG